MLAGQMEWIQGGGEAIGLSGWKLTLAVSVIFLLGAFMPVGIGLYAPCMALVYALGLSPLVAFPIMTGSCAFLMPPASAKFIREGAYNRKAAISMAIPGAIAVLIAALLVKSLPLDGNGCDCLYRCGHVQVCPSKRKHYFNKTSQSANYLIKFATEN